LLIFIYQIFCSGGADDKIRENLEKPRDLKEKIKKKKKKKKKKKERKDSV
jgi:hypothetical protein